MKCSHNWSLIIIIVLCGLLGLAIYSCLDMKADLANRDVKDSILFKDSRALYISHIRLTDSLQSELNKSDGLRASERIYHEQRENVLITDNKLMRRQLASVNTETSTTIELDSIQSSLYGPAPDDSTHTIPLEYSRQLTGDALRLPIVESMLTNTETQLDEWKGHYTRMEGSYKVDLETCGQVINADHETIEGFMRNTEKMQGELNDQGRKFRRQRRRERVIEGLVIAGVIALAL